MYFIHLRGTKKAVYMVRCNLMGYGLPEITKEEGTEDSYVMHCELETKHDVLPNQHGFGSEKEVWDGDTIDLSDITLEDILSGTHDYEYSSHELDMLSGLFAVDIEVLNDPEDKWWVDAECDPQYPFCAYSEGKEIKWEDQDSDDQSIFSF